MIEPLHPSPVNKPRIAFVPYQASMWDALDSIWLAAVADGCEVAVIPAPYTKQVSRDEYETDTFPERLKPQDWRQGALARFAPDIIYIHNPYDDENLVTRVHPDFYSSTLSRLGTLVYVPYYLHGDGQPPQHAHLPAYSNADIIISQPCTNDTLVPGGARARTLELGSPKVDAVLARASATHRLGRMPTILLNTSLSSVLRLRKKAFTPLMEVMKHLLAREDVRVIWRPHPLMASTVASMAPELTSMLEAVVATVQKHPRVELDTSPDLYDSLENSDAYFGEETSSMVHLWAVAGKPVFIWPEERLRKQSHETRRIPWTTHAQLDKGDVWFADVREDTLAHMNLDTGRTHSVAPLGTPRWALRAHNSVVKVGSYVVATPWAARCVSIVELGTGAVRQLPVGRGYIGDCGKAVRWREQVVIAPGGHPAVTFVDPRSDTTEVWDGWMTDLGLTKAGISFTAFNAVHLHQDTLYVGARNIGAIIGFDLVRRQAKLYSAGSAANGFQDVAATGSLLWFAPSNAGAITCWDMQTGDCFSLGGYPEGFEPGNIPFVNIVAAEDGLYAFPRDGNSIIRIDPGSGSMESLDIGPSPDLRTRLRPEYCWPSNYLFAQELGDGSVLAQAAHDLSMIRLRSRTDWYRFLPRYASRLPPEPSPVRQYFQPQSAAAPWACTIDGADVTLDMALDYVARGDHDSDQQRRAYAPIVGPLDGTVGRAVHDRVTTLWCENTS